MFSFSISYLSPLTVGEQSSQCDLQEVAVMGIFAASEMEYTWVAICLGILVNVLS